MADAEHVLELHVDVYPLAAVKHAVEAFAGRATIGLEAVGEHHRVVIATAAAAEAERLARELANFALAAVVAGAADEPDAADQQDPAEAADPA